MIAKKVSPPSPAINVWGIEIGLDVQLIFFLCQQYGSIMPLPNYQSCFRFER